MSPYGSNQWWEENYHRKKVEKLLDLENSPFGNHNLNNGFKKMINGC